MIDSSVKRLYKLEKKMYKIVDDLGFTYLPIEWDIIPEPKMWEILAYRGPIQISNWKFGRNYERQRTIAENISAHLPYECVIFGDPCRAYLMRTNPFAVQALVMAHVIGHSIFFKENRLFEKSRIDMMTVLSEANHRFNEYEKIYGIDEVERTVDAGHAIQMHSSPFDTETEEEKKIRVYEQLKQIHRPRKSEFSDITLPPQNEKEDVEKYNKQLFRHVRQTTPIEPTEDILRFIIDNSPILEDWQKDILEVLRFEGQYYWPIIRTKFMDEGFAVYIHELIMNQLFKDGDFTTEEHGQYNYSNSLVKAQQRMSMNPYLIGSHIWKDIEERWNKGRHGTEWTECTNFNEKEKWDTHEMRGAEKIKEVLSVYTDWMFFQDFLTNNMIEDLDLYIYLEEENIDGSFDYIRTDHTAEQIRQIIINSFSNTGIPKVEVVQGNFNGNQSMLLNHKFVGAPLDQQYTEETLKHIFNLWGKNVYLLTIVDGQEVVVALVKKEK